VGEWVGLSTGGGSREEGCAETGLEGVKAVGVC
jgi:hypothetical protein